MPEGVEWALHCCLLLAWLGPDTPVPTTLLAEFHGVRPPYLNKQLQALVRAGILTSTPGARGGFTLARTPAEITALDVVVAVDGTEGAFRCTEIRRRGANTQEPDATFALPCAIASVMYEAEARWRAALRGRTLADIIATVADHAPGADTAARDWFAQVRAT